MRALVAVQMAVQMGVLLCLSAASIAAEVEYQHPNLTIVAKDEPLDSVLKSVSREMRIFVTTPTGLNPVVNCDIQNQPIKLALKKLLGDMSYSLEWKDDGESLVGLTILAGTTDSVAGTSSVNKSAAPVADQSGSVPAESRASQASVAPVPRVSDTTPSPVDDDSAMAAQREEMEAHMAEEREAREAEMEVRRQEEVIAHEARMAEEAVRNEAEMAEYFESQGINPGK